MKLTNAVLRKIVSEEKENFKQELRLREHIRRHVKTLVEDKPKAGSSTSDAEGSIDVKKVADTLGIDPGKLKTAVTNIRAGKRNSTDNALFGDMIAKLIDADPASTTTVMNVLKKVSAEEK